MAELGYFADVLRGIGWVWDLGPQPVQPGGDTHPKLRLSGVIRWAQQDAVSSGLAAALDADALG